MARQVLFVQGGGDGVHDTWDNKLVASLEHALGPGYELRYPRMPNEADPDFAPWKSALVSEIAALADGAVIVGHSVGGTILINLLAEQAPPRWLAGVFLIAAPFVGDGGWPAMDVAPMGDIGSRLPQGMPLHLYHGDADEIVPVAHLALYAKATPQAVAHRLAGRGHQFDNDLSEVAADIRRIV